MSPQPGLRPYLASTAAYLVAGGIQMVLFPWLVAVYLMETPARLGYAQTASQLPMLLLILWGGLLGDRVDQRQLLLRIQLIMSIPPLIMAGLVLADAVVYESVLAWAFVTGTCGALSQPARDALLNRVAGNDVQRVVTLAIGVQFGVQVIGFAIGSVADATGPAIVLLVQTACVLVAATATTRIPRIEHGPSRPHRPALTEIAEGIRLAWRSEVLRPAVLQIFAVGVFFAGAYLVVLPLMVRDIYHGDASGIAMVFGANMLGTCAVVFVLMRRGGVERPGRALVLGGLVSALVLSTLHFELPLPLFYAVVFCWGMCGGVSMTMSRAIVQEAAPDSHRARLLSVYSLGMMGGMPIGSVLLGWSVEILGSRDSVLVSAVGMLLVILVLALFSKLWHVTRRARPAESAEAGAADGGLVT